MTHTTNPETITKFKAANPYLLQQIGPYTLWEHPTRGDEAPILMLTPNDAALVSTGFYDLGDFDLDLCHELDPDISTYLYDIDETAPTATDI